MRTQRITTILTSAYLSAMLASSVSPIRSDATLAAAIDPMAALNNAVSSLGAAGFLGTLSAELPSITQPTARLVADNTGLNTDPVMTEELMARLIKRTLASKIDIVVEPKICEVFPICKSGQDTPAKQILIRVPEGKHLFMVSTKDGSNDIIVAFKTDTRIELYLTDNTGVLLKAAVMTASGVSLITNVQAAEKHKAELQYFAKVAQTLPAGGTPVAGK